MADATLKAVLLGEDRGASKAIKGVGDEAARTESRSHKLASGFTKVGKAAAIGLAGGIAAAGVAMVGMVKNAAQDQAAQRRLAVALENTAGATKSQVAGVEAWISKMGVATGVTDDDMRPALQRLVQATGDIGKAQGLMKLSLDASAGSGKSLEAVTTALSKAQNGNMGALSKLGIRIKDTHGKALSFDQVVKNMSETFAGQASAKAQSFDGKMQRLRLVFDETKETIGGYLIPILSKLATWFLNVVKSLQSGTAASGAFHKIITVVGNVVKAVGNFVGHDLVPFIKDLADRFRDAMGGTDGFKKSLKDMQPAIDVVKRLLGVLWENLKWAARTLVPVVVAAFKLLAKTIGALGRVATWLWNNAFQPVLKFIGKGISVLLGTIGKMLSALGHVPGFGWAKDAGDKLQRASQKASDFADGIKKIPKSKKFTLTTEHNSIYTYTDSKGHKHKQNKGAAVGAGHGPVMNAVGTQFWRGGVTMVGERGPELVDLPRGSAIATAQQSARAMGPGGSADPGYVVVVVQSEDGKVIEQKLTKVRRDKGGRLLEFQK